MFDKLCKRFNAWEDDAAEAMARCNGKFGDEIDAQPFATGSLWVAVRFDSIYIRVDTENNSYRWFLLVESELNAIAIGDYLFNLIHPTIH